MKRGFTLIELMVVIIVTPIVVASAAVFYLEGRVSGARIEHQVAATRSVSLAHEIIARDLRNAQAVTPDGTITIDDDTTVSFVVDEHGLTRTADGRTRVISKYVDQVEFRTDGQRGFEVTLGVSRRLLPKRYLRLTRENFVARRK